MNAQEAIRAAMGKRGWSQCGLADAMGTTRQNVSNKMRGQDVKAAFLAEALGIVGYDLCAVPKGTRMPDGALVIGGAGDMDADAAVVAGSARLAEPGASLAEARAPLAEAV